MVTKQSKKIIFLILALIFISIFYKEVRAFVTKEPVIDKTDATEADIPLGDNTDHIYYMKGNLNIRNNISGNQSGVIFVEKDLTIGPIPGNKLIYGTASSGLVFVVRGNVNILKDITQIDGVIISEGIICTAYEGTACLNGTTITPQLVINGSLVSLNPTAATPIQFRRNLADNTQPAELINHQVKYLVILRDLLSDTLQKWSEIP